MVVFRGDLAMYRLFLSTGMVALLVGAMVFAAQVREETQKTPPPATNPQKGVFAGEKAPADKQAPAHQKRPRVYLGVFTVPVEDMTNRTRKKLKLPSSDGVYVAEVLPDSPAEEAGIKHGDVITHVNGQLIEDEDELSEDLHKLGAGKEIDLAIVRDGKKQNIKAKLAEVPANQGKFGEGEGNEELAGMCQENAQHIQMLERRISRLEKRLSEMEKARSGRVGQ
jgi:membrane-associated protease RseP (regulator of RpoE activity)